MDISLTPTTASSRAINLFPYLKKPSGQLWAREGIWYEAVGPAVQGSSRVGAGLGFPAHKGTLARKQSLLLNSPNQGI